RRRRSRRSAGKRGVADRRNHDDAVVRESSAWSRHAAKLGRRTKVCRNVIGGRQTPAQRQSDRHSITLTLYVFGLDGSIGRFPALPQLLVPSRDAATAVFFREAPAFCDRSLV